jgi:uncharacterized repeat protein (TIGR03803 family)
MNCSKRCRKPILALLTLTAIVACAGTAHAGEPKYRTLYTFQGGPDGWLPVGVPAVDKAGNLYGTTQNGGLYDYGTIFELTAPKTQEGKWKKTVLYNFTGVEAGEPSFMVFGPDGALYGVAGSADIFSLTPPSPGTDTIIWTFQVLYTLSEDAGIVGNPVFDAAGNLYGVTGDGGNYNCGNGFGCGFVFELERPQMKGGQWQYEELYAFTGTPDGESPFAGVTFDQQGNLWGTTVGGGDYDWGSVYQLIPPQGQGQGWTESVVYSFDRSNNNIISPYGPVAFDSSGNLYSTTFTGGDQNCDGGFGCGVVFELAYPGWTYSTLYEFEGGKDGVEPQGYIVFDSQGNLYSTTAEGGGKDDAGVAFRLTPSSNGYWMETVLHRFFAAVDGGPDEGLTWGKWGNLYGVTLTGGKLQWGTVFEVRP